MRRWWAVALVPSLLLLLPAGVALLYDEGFQYAGAPWVWGVAAVVQVAFAWLMCFGSMGLFRWIFARERFWVRYLSDASYWLYLTHLPLVIGAQMVLVTWPISIHLKFLLISTTIVAGLLVVLPGGRALYRDRGGDERAAQPPRSAAGPAHGASRGSRRVSRVKPGRRRPAAIPGRAARCLGEIWDGP